MSGPSGGGAGAAARRPPPRMGGPFGGPGLPAEKPKNLKGSFLRLAGTLRPEAPRIALVIALAILSVTCAVVGPKILGNATDIIFDGVVSQQIPAGLTQQQAVDALRASGQTQQADLLASLTLTPGRTASTSRPCATPCCSWPRSTSSARSSPGASRTSWPASPSAPSTGCGGTSTPSCRGCP